MNERNPVSLEIAALGQDGQPGEYRPVTLAADQQREADTLAGQSGKLGQQAGQLAAAPQGAMLAGIAAAAAGLGVFDFVKGLNAEANARAELAALGYASDLDLQILQGAAQQTGLSMAAVARQVPAETLRRLYRQGVAGMQQLAASGRGPERQKAQADLKKIAALVGATPQTRKRWGKGKRRQY